ncbi:MAG: class E sortase [Chloroflexi bacterium]|nr:class E sortase [Chloroflexota bacterium]
MDSPRRTRAAAGFTLILLSGLGLLAMFRALSPDTARPSDPSFTTRDSPASGRPHRLFEVPLGALATREAENSLPDSALSPYLLYIPRLDVYASVVPIVNVQTEVGNRTVSQLSLPPAYAVGWSADSARVGQPGNTVFVGHNNEFGSVFRDLNTLVAGDEIFVRTNEADRLYLVTETEIFEEQYLSLDERLENAKWIAPTPDERLTLVTCWPYFTNTHRVVVVARPEGD